MKKESLLKKEADRLMKIKGNARGATFRTHEVYIRNREGEKGVKEVEAKLKELGYPFKFKEIDTMGWYPEGLSTLIVLVSKELFHWKESDIFDMGNSAPKYSFIVRFLIKYFLSLKKSFEQAPEYWKKHLDFGRLENVEFNEKEKYLIVRAVGYKFHPIMCIYHKGYFLRIAQHVLPKATIEETKCIYKGDPYDEYVISWK